MINVLKKYKSDIFVCGIITLIFFGFIILLWGRSGDTMVDCPRELYLPSEILNGKILYKDLFSLYQPLGYLVNSMFVAIFGSSLNLFYILGTLNTFVCLILIYFISRCFAGQLLSFSTVILTLFTCCLSNSMIVNYIFPYSYSFVYALSCFLASVLFFVLYFKNGRKNKFIFLSFLLAGFSVAFKFEFAFSFLPFFFVFWKNGKFQPGDFFKSLTVFILPAILSFSVPVIQSDFGTLNTFLGYLNAFFDSESTKYFMRKLCIKSPSEFVVLNLKHLLFFSYCFLPLGIIFWFKETKKDRLSKFSQVLIILSALCIAFPITKYIWIKRLYIFSYFPLIVAGFSIFYFIKYKSEKNDKNLFLLLFTTSIFLSSSRVYAYLTSNHYGKFILPMFFVAVFAVCIKSLFKDEKSLLYERIISYSILIFSSGFFFFATRDLFEAKNYRITSPKGIIWGSYPVAKTVEETAEYLKENTGKTDRVLVLPEGLLINYLADRQSLGLYYQLLPNHIDILSENKIVTDLKQNAPEYIVLASLINSDYGKSHFCFDFGTQICEFINSGYEVVTTFSNTENSRSFSTIVLKRNIPGR